MKVKSRAGRKRLLTPKEELLVSALAFLDPGTGRDNYTISELHRELSHHKLPSIGRTTIWEILQRTPFPEYIDPSELL